MDIIKLISEGLTIPQIAEKIGKSKSSVNRLLKKLNLKTKRHIDRDENASVKMCRYCNIEKKIEEFPVAGVIKEVTYYRNKCNICYIQMKYDRKKIICKWFEEFKKNLRCVNCGNNDFRVLEFHHKNDDKEFNVSDAVTHGAGKEKILKEVKKCDPLCANCHRIETYENRKKIP